MPGPVREFSMFHGMQPQGTHPGSPGPVSRKSVLRRRIARSVDLRWAWAGYGIAWTKAAMALGGACKNRSLDVPRQIPPLMEIRLD